MCILGWLTLNFEVVLRVPRKIKNPLIGIYIYIATTIILTMNCLFFLCQPQTAMGFGTTSPLIGWWSSWGKTALFSWTNSHMSRYKNAHEILFTTSNYPCPVWLICGWLFLMVISCDISIISMLCPTWNWFSGLMDQGCFIGFYGSIPRNLTFK